MLSLPATAQRHTAAGTGEVTDSHGIITSPAEGTHKYYKRSGTALFYQNSKMNSASQEGMIETVETADGTIYFKDFLSHVSVNTWVKGTRTGDTITLPQLQTIYYDAEYDYSILLGWATYDINYADPWVAADGGDITLTVSEDETTLTLNGTGVPGMGYNMVAALYAHNNGFAGYGDYETVLTLDPDFEVPELVELPTDAEVQTWHKQASRYSGSNGWSSADGTEQVAFADDKVYLSGLFANFPDAWIVGSIHDGTVTFTSPQYIGSYNSTFSYATGSTGFHVFDTLQDFTMTYDAAEKVLKSNDWLLANASLERISYMEAYTDITLQESAFPESAITTGPAVEATPYVYDFSDVTAESSDFGIYDANSDHYTWNYGEGAAYYRTNNNLAADDWLVSPAIKMEANKVYRIAIETKNSAPYWTERVEVKMAKEPFVSAFTTTVIAPTDVTWTDYQPIENDLFRVEETGYYHFGIHAISDEGKYQLYVQSFTVDGPTAVTVPQAVTNLTAVPDAGLKQVALSFTAPAHDINGDALTSSVTIHILRDGNTVGQLTDVAPGSAQTYADSEGLTVGTHTYQVITENADGMGRKSEEVTVTLSSTAEVPVYFDFTQADTFERFLIIDANADDTTWKWDEERGATYSLSVDNDADDYLVSPAIHMKAGQHYRIRLSASCALGEYPETFDVWLGKEATPTGLTEEVIGSTTIQNEDPVEFEKEIQVDEDGYYFIAIHASSDADMWDLYISYLAVEEGASADAPAMPTMEAEAGAEGALAVHVTATAPTETVAGASLSGTMHLDVLRDGEVVHTFSDVTPGETKTWTDTQVEDGISYGYQLIARNDAGRSPKTARINVFVGHDTPGALPGDVDITDHGDYLTLTWPAVDHTGTHGGYVAPDQVTYEIWTATLDDSWGIEWWSLDEKVSEVTGQTTADIAYVPKEQKKKYFGVRAVNYTGEGEVTYTRQVLVGRSYELPFYEGFAGGQLHYYWENNGALMTSPDATDGDGRAVELLAGEAGITWLHSGKIDIRGAESPTLLFDVKSDDIALLDILVSKDGVPMEVIQHIELTSDYQHILLPLTDWQDSHFVQIGVQAYYAVASETDDNGNVTQKGDLLTLDAIRVVDQRPNDLSIALKVRSKIKAGQTATLTATVTNSSDLAADHYTVTLAADGEPLLQEQVDEPLPPFASREFVAQLSTTIFDPSADILLTASVVCDGDTHTADNETSAHLAIVEPTVAAPEELTATYHMAAGADLTWTAPARQTEMVTEDFEDTDVFPMFSLGGITATTHTGAFDDWTLYDGNGLKVYRISNLVVPNSAQPSAWQVCRPSELTEEAARSFKPHSGEQFLWSFCPSEDGNRPSADHWLISPSLSGDAQTLTFYARCITSNYYYPETFEVLASTTDNDHAHFSLVESLSTIEVEWTKFTVDLPAGTKYFAIRHTSEDVFGMLIDDISYESGDGDVAGYHIYYDGEIIATVEGGNTTYTVAAERLLDGAHTFAVTAVYANGMESRPATVTYDVATGIGTVLVNNEHPADIYTIDGKLIRRQATTLQGLRGVYVIGGKPILVK